MHLASTGDRSARDSATRTLALAWRLPPHTLRGDHLAVAIGVFVGVLLASLFFAHKIGRFMVVKSEQEPFEGTRTYRVIGQVFFASSEQFIAAFDFKEAVENVVIDLSQAHFWDVTSVTCRLHR